MANKEKTILSLRLRLLRIAAGMKQEEVANMLGIGRSAYTYYESSRSKPDYDGLITLSKLFHVSIDYLVGLTNMPEIAQRPQIADGVPNSELAIESSFGLLTKDERYMLALYRQLSGDAQSELLETLHKKRARGE